MLHDQVVLIEVPPVEPLLTQVALEVVVALALLPVSAQVGHVHVGHPTVTTRVPQPTLFIFKLLGMT